jgi:alkylation response protein AidB-like acyl-CoA dehydrogenase
MDFAINEHTEAFRAEVKQLLDEQLTDEVRTRLRETGTAHDWGLHRAMAERHWIGAAWPREEGGLEMDPYDMEILYEELAAAGAPTDGFSITMVVAETIRRVGTAEQRERLLGPIQRGEIVVSLGYSEPDVGSDLASVKTKAVREGDSWRIDGQKAFTTMAHEASYVFLLARTDTEVAPHRGLTLFLVPTDADGFSLDPVHTLGGERTNMTYFNEVVVADENRIGEVDGGWKVIMLALAFERGGEFAAQLRRLTGAAAVFVAENGLGEDETMLGRVGRLRADTEVARLLGSRATWLRATDNAGDIEGTMAKLYATDALVRNSSDTLDAAGAEGLRAHGAASWAAAHLEHAYMHSHVTTIYGGTSEILRGVIAERRLGMPRNRPKGKAP